MESTGPNINKPFRLIYAKHRKMYEKWAEGDLVPKADVYGLIGLSLTLASEVTDIDNRKTLSWLLRFWAVYVHDQGDPYPDIDISTKDRQPSYLTQRTFRETEGSHWDTVGDLERYERNISLLHIAYILLHLPRVPETNEEMYKTMYSNVFLYGTEYIFLCSKSINEQTRLNLLSGFLRIAEEACTAYNAEKGAMAEARHPEKYIKIERLPYEWDGLPPFIFYETRGEDHQKQIVALRGHTTGASIDTRYSTLDPVIAKALHAALLRNYSGIQKDAQFVREPANIVPMATNGHLSESQAEESEGA